MNRLLIYIAAAGVVISAVASARHYWINEGRGQAIAEYQEQSNDRLREILKDYSRLITKVKKVQDDYDQQGKNLEASRIESAALLDRMRKQQADFERRLTTATATSVRDYAKTIDGYFTGCLADVKRLGDEAAECSRTAYALKAYSEASQCSQQ